MFGHFEIEPPIYENFDPQKKCVHSNGRLASKDMYLYQAFQLNVVNAFTTYTKHNYEITKPLLHV